MLKSAKEQAEQYFANIYSVIHFLTSSKDHGKKNIIAVDTLKCMTIMATLLMGINFGKGKTHYLKYVSAGITGMMFGLGYSFYFTSNKIQGWMADELLR